MVVMHDLWPLHHHLLLVRLRDHSLLLLLLLLRRRRLRLCYSSLRHCLRYRLHGLCRRNLDGKNLTWLHACRDRHLVPGT
jgi:hypothetical protein